MKFAVVVLDRWTVDIGVSAWILEFIDTFGLNPLLVRTLAPTERLTVSRETWNGRTQNSSGPHLFIPIVDLAPEPPSPDHLRKDPKLDNARLLKVASRCHRSLQRRHPQLPDSPVMHVSKNAEQAWKWVRSVMPEEETILHELLEARRRAFETPFPVLQPCGGGAGERAKVEVVDFHGQAAVCKTFRPGMGRFLQREIETLHALQQTLQVPDVLARGENWFVMPLYRDSGRYRPNRLGMLSLAASRDLIRELEKLFAAGYAHLDMRSNNLIYDERKGLKLMDFEFAYQYMTRPKSFDESYDIAGIPMKAAEDLSPHGIVPDAKYSKRLQHLTGLSFKSLRNDPEWKQHLKRASYAVTRAVPRVAKRWLRERLEPVTRWVPSGTVRGGLWS